MLSIFFQKHFFDLKKIINSNSYQFLNFIKLIDTNLRLSSLNIMFV